MEIRNDNKKPTKIARYPLASAGRRILARFLDIVLVGLVVFGLSCAIICTNPGFDRHDLKSITQTWRYTLVAIVSLLVFFLYFLLLPFFWKKTLFMKVFKLQYVNNLPLRNFMLGLIKHELLVWIIISLISLISGIVLGTLNVSKAISMIHGMSFKSKMGSEVESSSLFYVGIAFATMYLVALLFTIFILISTCVKSKKPAFHDKFSDILVIHLVQTDTPNKQANIKKKTSVNYGVPGSVSSGAFEEIDKF